MFDVGAFKKTALEKTGWLAKELQGLRTGRATPALLDGVRVEVFGSMMTVPQLATISVEDARTLYLSPWDKGQAKALEKAIILADLGVSVGADERGVRVSFPELTTERRAQLTRIVKGKLEEARVQLKNVRAKAVADMEKAAENDDEKRRGKDAIQKVVDETNKDLEALAEKKEAELKA